MCMYLCMDLWYFLFIFDVPFSFGSHGMMISWLKVWISDDSA